MHYCKRCDWSDSEGLPLHLFCPQLQENMRPVIVFIVPSDVFSHFPVEWYRLVSQRRFGIVPVANDGRAHEQMFLRKAWIRLLRPIKNADGENRRFSRRQCEPRGGGDKTRPPLASSSTKWVGWKKQPWLTRFPQTKTLISLWESNLPAKAKEDFFFLLNKLFDKLLIHSFSSQWGPWISASVKAQPEELPWLLLRLFSTVSITETVIHSTTKRGRQESSTFI